MAAGAQEEYLGSIATMVAPWATSGYAACDGSMVPVGQALGLADLLGAMWGGDGKSVIALPNLNGRVLIGMGTSTTGTQYDLAGNGGAEAAQLQQAQLPPHVHRVALGGSDTGAAAQAAAGVGMPSGPSASTEVVGGAQPVTIVQPFGAVAFQICMEGVWPNRD